MTAINLILGRTVADREAAIAAFSVPNDAVGRLNLFALRPTHRSLRKHQESASQAGQFLPRARVLDDFLAEIARRTSQGRAILSGSALALRLNCMAESASLPDAVRQNLKGPELGRQLAQVFSQLEEAGANTAALPPWMEGLFGEFRTALHTENQWQSLGSALRFASQRLRADDEDCRDLLQGMHSVWIEEPQGLSPARTDLLLKLVQLWTASGVQIFVSFASPLPLGADDLLDFFTGEEQSSLRLRHKSFDASARFRRTCFDAWAGESTTRFFWAENARVQELEPGLAHGSAPPPCLADGLYQDVVPKMSPDALAQATARIQIKTPASPLQECTEIAREIKAGWLAGRWTLSDTLIAVPDLPAYAPTLIQVFHDHGLPLDLSSEKHLIRSPLGALLASLLRLSTPGSTPEDFFDLIAMAPALPEMPLPIGRILYQIQCAQVRGARPAQWQQDVSVWVKSSPGKTAEEGLLPSLEVLDDLFIQCVQPLQNAQSALAFLTALEDSLRSLGFPDVLVQSNATPSIPAWHAVLELLQDCRRDVLALDHPFTDKEWCVAVLVQQLAQASYRPGTANPEAISVVGTLELRGLSPKHLWLAGLYGGVFPARKSTPPIVDALAWASLQWVNPMGEARSLLGAALREALLCPGHTLCLSWPQRKDARALRPAPPIEDFLALCDALSLVFKPPERAPRGLSMSGFIEEGFSPDASKPHFAAMMQAQAHRKTRRDAEALGPFDGRLGQAFGPPSEAFSVTRLERFVQCPARDWYARGLGLGELNVRSEDASALTVGTLLHSVLENFVRENMAEYRQEHPSYGRLAGRLEAIALAALEDPSLQPSMSEDARQSLREKWLPGLLDERPKGLLAAWLDLELERSPYRAPLAVEMDLQNFEIAGRRLKGRMDRVDSVGTAGLLVVDYKTGSPPSTKKLTQGLALQGFLYTEAAKIKWPNRTQTASVYSQIAKPDGIKDKAWMGDADLIKSLASRAKVVALNEARHEALLAHTTHAVEGLGAGIHHPTLAEPQEVGCEYCDFRTICRKSPALAARQSTDPDSCGPLEAE